MPKTPQFETIESRHYIFRANGTSGTGFLERKRDELSTARFVCSEGFAEYCQLKRAWRKRRDIFDSLCGEYFTPGSTVYDAADNMGYLNGAGCFVRSE